MEEPILYLYNYNSYDLELSTIRLTFADFIKQYDFDVIWYEDREALVRGRLGPELEIEEYSVLW